MTTNHNPGLLSKAVIRLGAALLLMAGLILGGIYAYTQFAASRTSAAKQPSVQTARATIGDLVLYASGAGSIIPAAESSIGFGTSGQVSEVFVEVGDQVEAGQVLAELDDTDLRIRLAEAQEAMDRLTSAAAIATAKQSLAEAHSDLDLAKDTLEYLISPEVLYWEEMVAEREQLLSDAQTAAQNDTSAEAKQEASEAEISLTYAEDQLKYFETFYEETYVPRNFTQTRTMTFRGRTITQVVQVLDVETGEMVDSITPPSEGEIAVARAGYELAKASIAEAEIYLDILNGSEIPDGATGGNLVAFIQTRHALEKAEYNLEAARIIAPFSGTVTGLDISVGDMVDRSAAITVSDLNQPYSLDVYLDEEDWGQVQVGYPVEVTFDIIPDRLFTGTVTGVYPTLDTTSSSSALLHIKARLTETIPYELPSGSAAALDVVGGRAENAVLVPVEALHEVGEGDYALFVMESGKIRLRLVEVGLQDLTRAEITAGVSSGEIVTTGVVETQ